MAGISPYVDVKFQGGDATLYTYRNHIPGLVAGDWVVVEVPSNGLKVVEVVNLAPGKDRRKRATKWLVDRVRFDKYRALSALIPPPEEE